MFWFHAQFFKRIWIQKNGLCFDRQLNYFHRFIHLLPDKKSLQEHPKSLDIHPFKFHKNNPDFNISNRLQKHKSNSNVNSSNSIFHHTNNHLFGWIAA